MSREIKEVCKYCDDYCELKEQTKNHVYRISCTDQNHLKKKDRFNEQEYANKLYQ